DGQPRSVKECGLTPGVHVDLAVRQPSGRPAYGRGYGLQLPGFVRLGRGRENERGRFRRPTEDLMPDEDREEAEEGEAQAPPEGSAELSVIYEDHHDDGGQGYEGRTGERKADDAVADRRNSVRARGTIARPHLTPPAPPGSARGSRSRAPGPVRRAGGRCIVPLRRGT